MGTTLGFGDHRAMCSDSALRSARPSPRLLEPGRGAVGESLFANTGCAPGSGRWALVWGLFLADVTLTFTGLWATQWHTVTLPWWNLKTPRASWPEIFGLTNVREAPGFKGGLPPTGPCGGPGRSHKRAAFEISRHANVRNSHHFIWKLNRTFKRKARVTRVGEGPGRAQR